MTPSLIDSREGSVDEGAKVAKSVNNETTKTTKDSEQGSLFDKPKITDDIAKDTVKDTVKNTINDTAKELMKKDAEIQIYKDSLAQKDTVITSKDKEIRELNEKVQVLESTTTKVNREFTQVINTINDFRKRASSTRNWTEFNRFIDVISSLHISVNFT